MEEKSFAVATISILRDRLFRFCRAVVTRSYTEFFRRCSTRSGNFTKRGPKCRLLSYSHQAGQKRRRARFFLNATQTTSRWSNNKPAKHSLHPPPPPSPAAPQHSKPHSSKRRW